MTTTELNTKVDIFIQQWLGKRTDFDGAPKNAIYQCVDLLKRFWNNFWGTPNIPMGSALNYIAKPLPPQLSSFLEKVRDGSVRKGDAVILYTNGHNGDLNYGDGHIGLATGNQSSTTIEIVEQNGATGKGQGTGGDAIRRRSVDRARLAGVLRPRVTAPPTPAPAPAPSPLPAIGSRIKLIPTQKRTTFRAGTTTVAGQIHVTDETFIYEVRGYDPKYAGRILINSSSAGGNGVALALYYTTGAMIPGWTRV